jgi:drug/metabolite transporter (DMT)-like permease
VVLIGGTNFVAVRFSNRELPPFWGAGLRFAVAGLLLVLFARWRRIPLPLGSALPGVAIFGVINFGVSYALAYWGLLAAPAAMAATFTALAPLMTFAIAVALGMERFRWAGLGGGSLAVAGVALVFVDQLQATVPFTSIVSLFLTAVGIAVATVLLKRLRRTHPIGTNAVAMLPGAAVLLALAFVSGERPTVPTGFDVWIAFLYLATIGAIGLFIGVVYVVQRWTASASAYVTVLFPVVTVSVGAILAREFVTAQFLFGAALVMIGTYAGALTQKPAATPSARSVETTAARG